MTGVGRLIAAQRDDKGHAGGTRQKRSGDAVREGKMRVDQVEPEAFAQAPHGACETPEKKDRIPRTAERRIEPAGMKYFQGLVLADLRDCVRANDIFGVARIVEQRHRGDDFHFRRRRYAEKAGPHEDPQTRLARIRENTTQAQNLHVELCLARRTATPECSSYSPEYNLRL